MKIVKGLPSTSQDDYQLNITTLIRHAARNFGGQEIVTKMPDRLFRYTYEDAYERIKRLANTLEGLEIKAGDRVGVLEWNTYRHYELFFGIPGTGAVLLQLNLRLAPSDLIYIINHAEAQLIFVDETLIPVAEAVAPELKTVKGYIIVTDKKLSDIETKLSPVYSYEDLLEKAKPEYNWSMLDERSVYAACYTTGTTGKPKGVYYSHRDVYMHTMQITIAFELTQRDCFLQMTPMFHAMGWGTPQAATLAGAKLLLPGRYTAQDMGPIIALMIQEKVTASDGAPAIWMPMLEHIRGVKEKPNLKGVQLICGASEPPIAMMKGFHELTGAEIVHSYGATETTPLITVNRAKPWLEDKLSQEEKWDLNRKQGLTLTGLDVKLVDPKGKELPQDGKSAGEVLVRGPWVTASYYNAPGTESQFSVDGYWRSGDIGTLDTEGYLKLTDRVKDVIKSGGEWISSVDMENEIMGHPGVLEATVVGVPHPKWEERPLPLVVLREESKGKVTKEDIIDHLGKRFAKWQLPDEVKFVDIIPKTSVGKFDKKVIRGQYKDVYMRE
ncbi:MAG: long-chain fatty acid--CoA ligase [Dehalococcoidia bacterium]|nr:long-chain fatty acid--CoA ligase [Dehalococcoidia bacterium]